MKKVIFLMLCLSALFPAIAQERKCGSHEHMLTQMAQDPSAVHRMKVLELQTEEWIQQHKFEKTDGTKNIVVIPVVVHVVYAVTAQNISDAQVLSQIDALNRDFRKQNSDTANIPAAFKPVAADCEIQFCLASVDPLGQPTTGITRTSTTHTKPWFKEGDSVKYTSRGGHDAWDSQKYLNLWVCRLESGLLGYAQFPLLGLASTDGVVCHYQAFGTIGSLLTGYTKGRTAVHEVGHYLNLRHIWGDNPDCQIDDGCSDTPTQAKEVYTCSAYPVLDSCQTTAPGIMLGNYMGYATDACTNMFTGQQKYRMLSALNFTRLTLKNSDAGCVTSIKEDDIKPLTHVGVFPNPSQGLIKVYSAQPLTNAVISIYNSEGRLVRQVQENNFTNTSFDLDNFVSGIYFVRIVSDNGFSTQKLVLEK